MTELTQPLATPLVETIAASRTRETVAHSTTFPELVYTHFDWWRGLRDGGAHAAAKSTYHHALADFEARTARSCGRTGALTSRAPSH